MKKFLIALALVGWFFAMRAPDGELKHVMITTIVEGFGSEAECKAYREDTLDMLQALGMKLESTKCAEKKGA
jgi:hypothetical protein